MIAPFLLVLLGLAPLLDARVIRAGHDAAVEVADRRFAGQVVAVGAPDAKGEVFSFRAEAEEAGLSDPVRPASKAAAHAKKQFLPAEIKSWRLTIVSGELFGASFQVREHGADLITVTDANGPLNGLAAGDRIIIQRIFGPPPPIARH